jgi:hypothetical protein
MNSIPWPFNLLLLFFFATHIPLAFCLARVVAPSNDRLFFSRAHKKIADTLAVGAFFVAVIPRCLTKCTFVPIRYLSSKRINAVAALFAFDFGTATVRDSQVVTSAATL